MNRIKDLNKVKPQGANLWCKVVIKEKPKSMIIDPNKILDIDYLIVKNVGVHVTDVEEGDIILEFIKGYSPSDTYEIDKNYYVQVPRNVCKTVVEGYNFDDTVDADAVP